MNIQNQREAGYLLLGSRTVFALTSVLISIVGKSHTSVEAEDFGMQKVPALIFAIGS